MDIWVFAVFLLALGFCLKLLEFFFPSGGIFVVFAVASWCAAVYLAFQQGPQYGLGMLAVVVIGVPVGFTLMLRYWPQTSIGRRVLLQAPSVEDVTPDDPSRQLLKSLVGRVGRAKCKMLPSGVIDIDGQTYQAATVGVAIEAGQPVRVVKVEAKRLIVRPEAGEPPRREAENPLDRPIDDDPFGEPLA